MKKVLVLLASYNGERFIYDQLLSIHRQVGVEHGIFIFDDISTDNTLLEIKRFEKDWPECSLYTIVNAKQSGGAGANFMSAMTLLSEMKEFKHYDFVALSDQDDIWHPKKLEVAVENIGDSSGLYCGSLTMFDNFSGKRRQLKRGYEQQKFDHLFEGASAGCTYVFDKTLLHAVVEKRKEFEELWRFFSHDWFIYFVARCDNYKVYIDPDSYMDYRIHDSNVHGGMNTLAGIYAKYSLLTSGWYRSHRNGLKSLVSKGSDEYVILYGMDKSYISRVFILMKYNFVLFKRKRKFLVYFICNLLGLSR